MKIACKHRQFSFDLIIPLSLEQHGRGMTSQLGSTPIYVLCSLSRTLWFYLGVYIQYVHTFFDLLFSHEWIHLQVTECWRDNLADYWKLGTVWWHLAVCYCFAAEQAFSLARKALSIVLRDTLIFEQNSASASQFWELLGHSRRWKKVCVGIFWYLLLCSSVMFHNLAWEC